MATCRLCGKSEYDKDASPYGLIHYAVRHYAHADCALEKWGAAFFERLTDWQVEHFPYLAAAKVGLAAELERRIKQQAR